MLRQLHQPDHPEHHLVFDPSKFEFYDDTLHAMLGWNDLAQEYVDEVVCQCELPGGQIRWPIHLADSAHDNTAGTALLEGVTAQTGTVTTALVDQGFMSTFLEHGAALDAVERNPADRGFVPQTKRWVVEQISPPWPCTAVWCATTNTAPPAPKP
ncbi:hypothetical protein [Halostreptopolyspora alba]|uniref:Transposase IS4-like domain-containing protein n=1 Tax=Halostreptopolyspora alba TaxID=2487137 RepID=A0A3N0E8Q2_9ACTN|nr:hypothetical protein EFW17_13385 [Nocardiopsaceae bacterium YIM 96095]